RHTRFSRDWSSDVCSSDLIRSWIWCWVRSLVWRFSRTVNFYFKSYKVQVWETTAHVANGSTAANNCVGKSALIRWTAVIQTGRTRDVCQRLVRAHSNGGVATLAAAINTVSVISPSFCGNYRRTGAGRNIGFNHHVDGFVLRQIYSTVVHVQLHAQDIAGGSSNITAVSI